MSSVNPYTTPQGQSGVGLESDYQPKIFTMKGRIGRLRYLAYSWAWGIISMLPIAIAGVIAGAAAFAGTGEIGPVAGLLIILGYIISFVGTFGMAKRRLNDMDRSGWLSLLLLLPFINFAVILFLIFGRGTQGSNSYGLQTVPNTTAVWVFGLAAPILSLLVIIGVLAAVAIPAYQGYVEQAQTGFEDRGIDFRSNGTHEIPVAEAMSYTADLKERVEAYAIENQDFPAQNADIGHHYKVSSPYLESIDITTGGIITVSFSKEADSIMGETLVFRPLVNNDGYIEWDCSGGSLATEYRPTNCQ
ncbi:hypothetical protein NBRC116494_05620 [Aurantivibrio plasticivorans]